VASSAALISILIFKAIEKFMSEFAESGIYPLNPDLFIEGNFIYREIYHCSECNCVNG
jgi:hypothetical protein